MEENIRKMQIEDFEEIMKIFNVTNFGCIGMKELFKPEKQEQMLMMREILSGMCKTEELIILEKNNKLIGYATIQEIEKNTWHIGQIAINPNYQKQGNGKKLLKKIQQLAQENKKDILLECFEKDNQFFTKENFEKIKEDKIVTYYIWRYDRKKEVAHIDSKLNLFEKKQVNLQKKQCNYDDER